MEKEKSISSLAKDIANYNTEIYLCESKMGSGNFATHQYFYVKVGGVCYTDEGTYKTPYSFAFAMSKLLKEKETDLAKNNIAICWENQKFYDGTTDCFNIKNTREVSVPVKVLKIVPCKEFTKLQKWLLKYCNYEITPFDLYSCSLCQKRENKSYSCFNYSCTNQFLMEKDLEALKKAYKKGYKVEIKKTKKDSINDYTNTRYEFEQYGISYSFFVATIVTTSSKIKVVEIR